MNSPQIFTISWKKKKSSTSVPAKRWLKPRCKFTTRTCFIISAMVHMTNSSHYAQQTASIGAMSSFATSSNSPWISSQYVVPLPKVDSVASVLPFKNICTAVTYVVAQLTPLARAALQIPNAHCATKKITTLRPVATNFSHAKAADKSATMRVNSHSVHPGLHTQHVILTLSHLLPLHSIYTFTLLFSFLAVFVSFHFLLNFLASPSQRLTAPLCNNFYTITFHFEYLMHLINVQYFKAAPRYSLYSIQCFLCFSVFYAR